MGAAGVETTLEWNRGGKSHSFEDSKRLINQTCLRYIESEYEYSKDYDEDDYYHASLGSKDGVIVSYFPQLTNEEIKTLGELVEYGSLKSQEDLEKWISKSGEWLDPYDSILTEDSNDYQKWGIGPLTAEYKKLANFYIKSNESPILKNLYPPNRSAKNVLAEIKKIPPKDPYKQYRELKDELKALINVLKEKKAQWTENTEKYERGKGDYRDKYYLDVRATKRAQKEPENVALYEEYQDLDNKRKELRGVVHSRKYDIRDELHSNGVRQIWLEDDDRQNLWDKSKLSLDNLLKMRSQYDDKRGEALAIANNEIVWLGGMCQEG